MSSHGFARRSSVAMTGLSGNLTCPHGQAVHFRILLALILILPCGGCLVGPNFSSPSAPVADKWLESSNPTVDTRDQEYRDWWAVFRDPVLNRLIAIAYN